MRNLEAGFEALIEASTQAVLAGFDTAADDQIATRKKGADLRAHASVQALLGPTLAKFAAELTGEVERRTMPRYAAILSHPRYGREQLIDELTDAEVTMNVAIDRLDQPPTAQQTLGLTLAAMRVRAITLVLQGRAFADPVRGKGAGGPAPRRREVGAADVDPVVAGHLVGLAELGDHWRDGLKELSGLEATNANRAGLVTKLLALFDQADGREHLDRLVGRLENARRLSAPGSEGLMPVEVRPPVASVKREQGGVAGPAPWGAPGLRPAVPHRASGGIAARLQANRDGSGGADV